ncbi:MAG: hypothetical protein WCC14_21745 [Acidobacteriaceae bacterium]
MIPRRDALAGHRRSLLVCLAALALALAAPAQYGWHPGHHGPPWDAPVASSHSFRVGGATIQVDFAPGSLDLPPSAIVDWVETAASSVSTYYGRFPVPRDRILVQPVPGASGVLSGTTWGAVGGFPAFSRMRVGQQTTVQQLTGDWTMTHELVHTAFPSQSDEHHWIEEGIAVYVEPIARVQNGKLTPEKIWSDMVRDMPKGNPQPGDRGLDRTHTWGRTYWGGAQFCLLADVTLREQTHNRFGLQDALRAILAAGGNIAQNWPIEKAFKAGDHATGTHVLERLYARMKDKPVPVDLDAIWKKLGIIRTGEDQVRFDNAAPEAAIRLAITKTPPWGRITPAP